MKRETIRMNVQISRDLTDLIDKIATDASAGRSDVIRQALALMEVAHSAKQRGKYIGIVSDRAKLESEIVGVM
jgi:metal-responsive CopG/Arc/MetJ family transcriptional regulator